MLLCLRCHSFGLSPDPVRIPHREVRLIATQDHHSQSRSRYALRHI